MNNRRYPEAFQGNLRKKKYYEGWYNKIVDRKENFIYTFIPTIAINKQSEDSEAFIQILNGQTGKMSYIRYKLEDFENLSNTEFSIRINNNYFSKQGFYLDINDRQLKINGKIEYMNQISFPRSFLQPNIMGILNYVPFLETYHGIVSMNHILKGSLTINGKKLDFNGGKGYVEKDWGTSFPRAYIWAQTNHFSESNLSFVLSIALIPVFNIILKGFFCVIWNKGQIYKFATYTGARVKITEISSENIRIVIEDKNYSLYASLDKSNLKFTKLKAPKSGSMSSDIIETIRSKIDIILYDRSKKKIIIEDVGSNAGLDLHEIDLLL
jgi:hypothetical protein